MKKSVIVLIFILVFIAGIALGILGLKYYENNMSDNSNDIIKEDIEDNNTSLKEIEINLDDYSNLYFKIPFEFEISPYYIYEDGKWQLRNSDFTLKDLNNSWFLENALNYIEYYTYDWEDETTSTGNIRRKISASKVDETIKILFGKNFKYTHESTLCSNYKDGYYYIENCHGDEDFSYYVEDVVYKTTQYDDKIYIYEAVGVREEITKEGKTNLDYYEDKQWIYSLETVYLYNSLDLTEKVSGNFVGFPKITTNYISEHPDDFSHYRYTFTKENDNYILTNIEKL